MISKWSRPVTIVSFDFDLDKIFIGYQFVIISELVLDPAHLIRKRSWLAWVYTCTMYSIGVTNIKRVITRMRTIRRQDHEGRNKSTLYIKFQSSPSHGQFLQDLWRTGYPTQGRVMYLFLVTLNTPENVISLKNVLFKYHQSFYSCFSLFHNKPQ